VAVVIVESPSDQGGWVAPQPYPGPRWPPQQGRPPPRGSSLRVTPYGLHPPRPAAHSRTYTTSWDINPAAS